MSGNLWMFSDKLDDEDIEIMKHEFITYYQGADYYGLGLKMFTRLAHEAGAVYKIGKKVLIRRTIFDEYLALSDPITRAYLSHGWNCEHCRNYHYACPGMLEGTPCFFRSGHEIRGPCTQVENHNYNNEEILP